MEWPGSVAGAGEEWMRRGEAWIVGWGQRPWPQGTREGGGGLRGQNSLSPGRRHGKR